MSSAIISQTLQGAVLSATSNILAQVIGSYRENTPFTINPTPIVKFVFFSLLSNPPNILWQSFLEDTFPSNVPASTAPVTEKQRPEDAAVTPKTRMSKMHLAIKFLLDQTIGAVVNNLMFLTFMAYVNNSSVDTLGGKKSDAGWNSVWREVRDKFWPVMFDGMKFWPLVSLIGFLWVPVEKRVVFGCSVGVLWGIYLSLMEMQLRAPAAAANDHRTKLIFMLCLATLIFMHSYVFNAIRGTCDCVATHRDTNGLSVALWVKQLEKVKRFLPSKLD